MSQEFEPADYSFVVKRRGTPQKPWRWEIYCAGKSAPVERSPVFFESMAEAAKEGKKALAHFLAKRATRVSQWNLSIGLTDGVDKEQGRVWGSLVPA
jgi:predicted type IV restriction endonuclease